jgi:hypothetical protein
MCPDYSPPGPWIVIREHTYDELNEPLLGFPLYDCHLEISKARYEHSFFGPNLRHMEDEFRLCIKDAIDGGFQEYHPRQLIYRDYNPYDSQ